jgi:hypothetical protein
LSKGGANAPVFVMDGEGRERSKGFFEALTEIQQMYVAEKTGLVMDENYLTIEQRLEYWMIGLKSMIGGGLLLFITLPFAIAVIQQKLPIFTGDVTLFDKIYVILLSFSFIVGVAYFFYFVSKFNTGVLTRGMIVNMFSGLTIGVFVKTGLTILIYMLIRYKLLVEDKLHGLLGCFVSGDCLVKIKAETASWLYSQLLDLREIFIQSAITVLISNAIMLSFLWYGYWKHLRENRQKVNSWDNIKEV